MAMTSEERELFGITSAADDLDGQLGEVNRRLTELQPLEGDPGSTLYRRLIGVRAELASLRDGGTDLVLVKQYEIVELRRELVTRDIRSRLERIEHRFDRLNEAEERRTFTFRVSSGVVAALLAVVWSDVRPSVNFTESWGNLFLFGGYAVILGLLGYAWFAAKTRESGGDMHGNNLTELETYRRAVANVLERSGKEGFSFDLFRDELAKMVGWDRRGGLAEQAAEAGADWLRHEHSWPLNG